MSSSPKLKFRKKIRQRDGIVLQDLADAITLDVKQKRENFISGSSNPIAQEEKVNNHIITDVWFNIAEFIDPEDVGRFALICNQTAYVVSCAKFWTNLYRRFCKDNKRLPGILKSRCESQIGSLRSNVIRALYHLYPPFVARIKKGYQMSSLHGYRYFNSWHRKLGPYWFFYYKLWNHTTPRNPKKITDETDSDDVGLNKVLNKLNNVFENPDEGMFLLMMITKKFMPFPKLYHSTMILYSSRQLLNADVRNTNVELKFVPALTQSQTTTAVEIIYSSCKHKVVPWWHPDFEKIQLLD